MRHVAPAAAIMRCVTFDPFRTLAIPGTRYLEPEHWLDHVDLLREADWVLFPEYSQVDALHYGLGGGGSFRASPPTTSVRTRSR